MISNLEENIINLYHGYKIVLENLIIDEVHISDLEIENGSALLLIQKTCLSLLTNLFVLDDIKYQINYQNYLDLYKDIPDKVKAIEVLKKYDGSFKSIAQFYSKKLLKLVEEGVFSLSLISHRVTDPVKYDNASKITKSLLTQISILSAIAGIEKDKEIIKSNDFPKSIIQNQKQEELGTRNRE